MIRTFCPTCRKEVRISGGGTEMEWDVDGKNQVRRGDFHRSWVCPFCYSQSISMPDPVKK